MKLHDHNDPFMTRSHYTKRPHAFTALGVTCVLCGNLRKHHLHTEERTTSRERTMADGAPRSEQ